MNSVVVALSAAQGAGKTELATMLADSLGCVHASVSAYIAAILVGEGQAVSPKLLREKGELLARSPEDLVHLVLCHYNWTVGTALVFDAIRHAEVLSALRREVAPQAVLHVGLEVPEHVRESRFRGRNREPFDTHLREHSTEVQVPTLVSAADLILDGTRSRDQLVSDVLRAVRR